MADLFTDKLQNYIVKHEGIEYDLYSDTKGNWTIGVGHNIAHNGLPGYAINDILNNLESSNLISYVHVSSKTVLKLFEEDLSMSIREVSALLGSQAWSNMSDARKVALIDMCFHMGRTRLAGFIKMLNALRLQEWEDAANECLDSKYARQFVTRATQNAKLIRTGEF